jgi:hypothetical protein
VNWFFENPAREVARLGRSGYENHRYFTVPRLDRLNGGWSSSNPERHIRDDDRGAFVKGRCDRDSQSAKSNDVAPWSASKACIAIAMSTSSSMMST